MQFDMIHCSTMASLWEPGFVLASVLWAALLAYLLLRRRRADRSLWKAILVSALATPLAVGSLAKLVEFPSASPCHLFGRLLWMALPLAVPFVALGLLLPGTDRIAVAGRVVFGLACLHAWWTVTLFRKDVGRWIGPSSLVGLEEKVAPAPWVAAIGVGTMFLLYVAVERRAQNGSWRHWLVVRLQLLLAFIALVLELRYASAWTIFQDEPEAAMLTPLIVLVAVFAFQAWLRARETNQIDSGRTCQ